MGRTRCELRRKKDDKRTVRADAGLSKPDALVRISGAILASASMQCAGQSKWPVLATRCFAGCFGRVPRMMSAFQRVGRDPVFSARHGWIGAVSLAGASLVNV